MDRRSGPFWDGVEGRVPIPRAAATLGFEFIGTGWGILWRTFAFCLGSIFLIPIPWLLRWYSAWFVSQLHVEDFAAHFD